MNRVLIVALGLLAMSAVVASQVAAGYGLVIEHVPVWGAKLGGIGIGKSIRYDHRFYPWLPVKPLPVIPPPPPPPEIKAFPYPFLEFEKIKEMEAAKTKELEKIKELEKLFKI